MEKSPKRKFKFWPLLGIAVAVDLILVLIYAVIIAQGLSGRVYSDALCTSAMFLGVLSALPVLFDAGRGMGLAINIGTSKEERYQALEKERRRREQGMVITFALVAATMLITLLSFIIGMLA